MSLYKFVKNNHVEKNLLCHKSLLHNFFFVSLKTHGAKEANWVCCAEFVGE
jgi:hypothetical protein